MCLLIQQPAGLTFPKADILDFVSHNADGFGFMFGDGKTLHMHKVVGKAEEVYDVYRRHVAGKASVLHFRMATHGATNLENAHPFSVTADIGMAHNGILNIGNPVHTHKTDTEHLVEYFIRPIALQSPDLLFTPAWLEMLGDLIGKSNRLAFAHRDGRIALVNGETGTTHRTAWLSNAYAWSAPGAKMGSVYSHARGHGGSTMGRGWSWDDDPYADEPEEAEAHDAPLVDAEVAIWLQECEDAWLVHDTEGLTNYARNYPARVATILTTEFEHYNGADALGFVKASPSSAAQVLEQLLGRS